MRGRHGGPVVSTAASQRKGRWFDSGPGVLLCGVSMFSMCLSRWLSPVSWFRFFLVQS